MALARSGHVVSEARMHASNVLLRETLLLLVLVLHRVIRIGLLRHRSLHHHHAWVYSLMLHNHVVVHKRLLGGTGETSRASLVEEYTIVLSIGLGLGWMLL